MIRNIVAAIMVNGAPWPATCTIRIDTEDRQRLPVEARNVLDAVIKTGLVDRNGLRERTGLSRGALRRAVRRLRRNHLIDVRCSLLDSSEQYYFVHPRCVVEETANGADRFKQHAQRL